MKVFRLLLYAVLLTIAFAVFYIFRPYAYLDNAKSIIMCDKGNRTFEVGWNFIYSFDGKLDPFNDAKARKLCEHNVIKDYNNTMQTPVKVNYRFEPKYIQESSWTDAVLMFFATIVFGAIIIEVLNNIINSKPKKEEFELKFYKNKNSLLGFFLFLILAIVLFFFLLKKPSVQIYCNSQVARKVNNFKRIIFKYGVFPIPEEEKHINSVIPKLYRSCLENEGF